LDFTRKLLKAESIVGIFFFHDEYNFKVRDLFNAQFGRYQGIFPGAFVSMRSSFYLNESRLPANMIAFQSQDVFYYSLFNGLKQSVVKIIYHT
jgi:hypothetical protein